MEPPSNLSRPTYEQLATVNAALRSENAVLRAQLAVFVQRLEKLEAELAAAKRKNSGSATPFSKGEKKSNPKKPGRKPGQGPFRNRQSPAEFTGPVTSVPVDRSTCECGGRLEVDGFEIATRVEVPPFPRPEVRAFKIAICRCAGCGKRVRGVHPEVAPDQTGATAHRLGERSMAMAHFLHYGLGMTLRNVCCALRVLCGLELTPSALTQDALRRTGRGNIGRAVDKLRAEVRHSAAVHTDDTSWRISGDDAWLMVFDAKDVCVYQVRRRHRNEEVREIIPGDYSGVMCTDRGPSYDSKNFNNVKQQKCMGHIQKNLKEVLVSKKGKSAWFARCLKRLFADGIALWKDWREGRREGFEEKAARLRRLITHHLRDRQLRDKDNQRILDGLGWHQDRGNLLRYLDDPENVEPTNNSGERGLKPSLAARKVSQCSKTDLGAEAHSAFCSVIATLRKRNHRDLVNGLLEVFRTGEVPGRIATQR